MLIRGVHCFQLSLVGHYFLMLNIFYSFLTVNHLYSFLLKVVKFLIAVLPMNRTKTTLFNEILSMLEPAIMLTSVHNPLGYLNSNIHITDQLPKQNLYKILVHLWIDMP